MKERTADRMTASADSVPSPRRFGLTLGPALLVVAAVAWWRAALGAAQGVAAVGLLLVTAGLLAPTVLAPLSRGWMAFGHLLGRVTTPLFFTLLWVVAFVPIGLLRRTFSRSPLARDPEALSYWVPRPPIAPDVARASMERQF
ncbi:SxtJ family membrane protein [Gemmatimonas phototrophica]|nr:SxtJ family membrane protein [Gemmatimonas phototrophica]